MPSRKEQQEYAVPGKKTIWPIYGLQALTPKKFLSVVERVLTKRHVLIGHPEVGRERGSGEE